MGHSAEGSEKKRFLSELFGKPESLPMLLFILFFAILFGAGPELRSAKYVFEPPWLLFTLNSFFITGLCLLIAGLCFRSFLRGGFLNVLLLGCGVLTFGLSSFAAGWLIHPPYGPNYTVTTHNIGVLFTAVLYFLSSLFTAFGYSMEIERRRVMIAAASCSAVFLLGAVLTAETVRQVLPPFYLVGEGPTVIRQVVLSVSVTFLLTSALLMMTVYAERKTGFLLYSITALLLISTGVVGVALAVPGSPLSWLGRAAQYLGNVYLVVASMQAFGEARSRGTTVERALADYFRKAETHYRALVEMATDAIVACDREGRILLMNPAAGETFGYGPGEAVGRSLEELIVPERSRDAFHACLTGESRKDIEMELKRKEGTNFPAEVSFSRQMKTGAGASRTIIVRDITERKRADEALRESESRFRTLAGATFEGVVITENGRFTDINEQFCKISGHDRSELLGMDVSRLVHPDDRDRVLDNILAGLESAVEHRMFRKDGSTITVEAHGKTVRHDGHDRRLTAVRDITEVRKAEETIKSTALFPIQNPEPVMRIHWDGTLLFSNPAADPVLAEWRAESGNGIPARLQQAVEAALNEGVPLDLEFQVAGRDFSFIVTPIMESNYANLYGWDVTESKRAKAALKESEQRYRGLFESMHEGFALHELLYDESDEPCDYRFLDVNPAFERQTGLKREDVVGKTVIEVMPGTEPLWIKRYGEVALTGTPAHFESHSTALGRDYEVFAYRPAPGQFAVIFMDITDRRRAEESLRASYDLLKIAQQAANAGIWAWDVSTGQLTWSEEFYRLFGLDPMATASFETWLGVLHPDDRQPAMERITRSVKDGTPLENEYRIIRPDGQERWIRAWGSTFYDENAQPLSMSGICIDATESKRAEEALRASELRMKAVADHLPVGVWFADETGKIIYGNEAGRRIWAGAHYVDPEEFHVYRAWWADTGKSLGPEDWAVVRAVKKGEASLNEMLDIECFDGTRKTILNSAVPLKADEGSLLGVVVLNEDVTERIEAERALRRSEARYRSYIEVTGQMGWATNADGEVVEDAPGFRQYTGQTFDELRGRGWSKALHPDDVEITLAVWRKAIEEQQGYETEFRLRRHDGAYRHFLARGVPILNDDGSVREWVGTCFDITERRMQEEELRKLNRTLRALSRSNEALMRAEEESAFLKEVCRIVVQDCGYAMVWIGYASDDDDKTVRPVAHAGFSEGYLETLNLTWADRERGRGPTGTAIRTGKTVLCTDMLTDQRFEPWRDEAVRRGYASSLALPLLEGGRAFGAVTIYSTQPDPFSEEEIVLLSEMADDLTYGIASLRLRRLSLQTLQALQESEARFRQLADSMPQLVWTAEPDGRVDYFNRQLSLLTTHGPWRPCVHYEDYRRTVEAWKSAIRTGSPYEIEHRLQFADGRFRWFLTRAVPVPDEAGHVIKWYGTSTDMHDRKQAEEEREIARIEAMTEKNRLEALIKALPVGVALVDTEGGTIQSNDMFERLWGGQRPETISVDDYDKYKAWWIDSGRQVQPEEWASARASKKGEAVTGQLMQIERFDGTTAFVMNSAVPIHGFDGRITGSAVAILDITERIKAEQALQQAKEGLEDKVRERTTELILLLEDLEKGRDDLRKLASELVMAEERERKKISVALHDEVAQTLAAARMRIDLLRSKPGDDDSRRALDEAQQLLVQAIRETRSLMTDISNPVLYDMGLQVAVQSLTEEVKARNGISFSSSFSGSLRKLDQDMEVMIFQVVKELVQNIVKHSGARKASIGIVEERDDIKVVVADDGLGFDVGGVRAVGLDGGFGLFSIRERVKSYNGKIQIESEPGKGSEVTVMLPKRAAGVAASRKTQRRKGKV
jgi:PAS domain S-box-containing protein